MDMFSSMMSPGSSPCPSPVRELAASLKRATSPRRKKYTTLIGSKEPIISKGRLTMTGGFTDLRPQPVHLEKSDSVESAEESSSVLSSRSDSYDSGDAIMESPGTRHTHRFVKIPKRALAAAMGHLSPRLHKKLQQAEKREAMPQHPMWPTVMATYGRGVSNSPVQAIMMPMEPSITAMKAQAILDERRDIRIALQMLAYKARLQRQVEAMAPTSSPLEREEDSSSDSSDEDDEEYEDHCSHSFDLSGTGSQAPGSGAPPHEVFPINPAINVHSPRDEAGTPDEGFQDESVMDALDLDALPTLTPEELVSCPVTEVRNVHLVCDYIVLETGPPRDSVEV